MSTRLTNVVIDAAELAPIAGFWKAALGWEITYEAHDEVVVGHPGDGEAVELVELVFVPVPEPKTVKNRVHLDLASRSVEDQQAIVDRLTGLGATPIDIGQDAVPWVVLADPDGNEFCVLEPREEYSDTGALAAIVVDAAHPQPLAAFWAEAAGWPVVQARSELVGLRAPSGGGPWLEFVQVSEPKQVKNRVHLDVAPWAADNQATEVARLEDLGAKHADVGQRNVNWVVFADPEDNEFCVLSSRG
jgi:predicted enzyme related to lactoylglutathione lyase